MGGRLYTGVALGALVASALAGDAFAAGFKGGAINGKPVERVLLISIDGMHALDFANCVTGVNGGAPYCPNLAALAKTGVSYTQAMTPKPSDSFPGLVALITGASPHTSGTFYDVSYDRALSPPAKTTPYGIPGGACPSNPEGTQVGFDEEIDFDYTQLNGGAASANGGNLASINPQFLPRDPSKNCAPVYPHEFIKVNTIFEVVKQAGGRTAWSDKHPSYDFANGISGTGVDDLYSPEINSIPVNLPQVKTLACNPLPDQTAVKSTNAWTDSFKNIQCYDSLKVQAILNEIDGFDHSGKTHVGTPNLFGMNFQTVSVGQKLIEASISTNGGYLDAQGTPSAALQDEIAFTDKAIGSMITALKNKNKFETTAIIITAKHGQSPIDRTRLLRIPGDDSTKQPPSNFVNNVQADEDDISMLWLADRSATGLSTAVAALQNNAATIGANAGEIFYGPSLGLMFDTSDSRTPDIVVAPNVGVVYTGGKKKDAEHGGWANDDRNVMLLVSHPGLTARTYVGPVATQQVAPTILSILGENPDALIGVRKEGVKTLAGL
jgi:hypothetical protein